MGFFVIQNLKIRYVICYKSTLNYDKRVNVKSLRQNKGRFSVNADQILVFASSTNLVREVKNFPLNFKQIA